MQNGIDDRLSSHISQLFIRDPFVVYNDDLMFPCCQENCMLNNLSDDHPDTPVICKTHCDENCEIVDGVCTKWWSKCPQIEGNSLFESLQSTNWNSMRFKNPPTADSEIGWRVEFRPMDLQLTDFENTAVSIMVGMIANIINTFDVDFIVPITLVDENMKRAHCRDAVSQVKFWWKVPLDDQAGKPFRKNDNEQTQFLRSNAKLTATQNN